MAIVGLGGYVKGFDDKLFVLIGRGGEVAQDVLGGCHLVSIKRKGESGKRFSL